MKCEIEAREAGVFDCVVCGGGASGVAAALAASRAGLSVAIVEQSGCFGGTATGAKVCHLLGGRKYRESTGAMERVVGGIFDEIADRLVADGGAIDPDAIDVGWNPHGWYPRMAAGVPIDCEAYKALLDAIILEERITPFLFTKVVGAKVDRGAIRSLIVNNKGGFWSFSPRYVIDATGDGDIAFLSGCPMEKGRRGDGLMTPATTIFHVDRVDGDAYVAYQNEHRSPKLVEIISRLKEEGAWRFPFDIFIAIQLNDKDVFMVNTLRQIGVDGTDGDTLTRAIMEGRKDARELLGIMREHFPGFKNARIRLVADSVGIRETRRVAGVAHVSIGDALAGKKWDDCVCRTTYNFDLPDPLRPSYDPMMGSAAAPNAEREHEAIEVPYGVMVPRNVDNLLVTGRAVSVDREVLGPLRVMGPCMLLGQAAGTAAGIAQRQSVGFPGVDGREVRRELMAAGCALR